MMFKRSREDMEVETLAMANCLMLLSRVGKTASSSDDRVFECKTCNKQFSSFQALGGHRASHKKPRLMGAVTADLLHLVESPAKPKTHECSICGQEFPMGQALGGHMRRHRAAPNNNQDSLTMSMKTAAAAIDHKSAGKIPVLKKCNSKRILSLDLNLTPYENELKLEKMAPALNCF